jgi:uncharacterized protein (TIRG00374 family)
VPPGSDGAPDGQEGPGGQDLPGPRRPHRSSDLSDGVPPPPDGHAFPEGGAPVPPGGRRPAPAGTAPPAPATSLRPGSKHAARRARLLRWWRSPPLRWAVAVVVFLFILEYALLPDIANAHKALHDLARVNIVVLLVAVLLEVLSLVAYAELSHTVLSPGAPRRSVLFRVNLSSLAVSHVVPGGTAPGTAVGYRLLTELDVPSGTAAFGLATQGVGSAVVLNVIFWFALLISIPLTGYNIWYGYAAIAGLILFALFAGTVLLLTRGQRQALERLHRWASRVPFVNADKVTALVQTIADRLQILARDRALVRHATVWAAANWLFDAASLWVFLLAFHQLISPIYLLVAYGLANILAVIPITPSGLGVVEGVLIPSLVGFHMPKAVATLGVLSYRLVNFWLPIPAGGAAYLSLRSRSDVKARRKLRIHLGRSQAVHDAGSKGDRESPGERSGDAPVAASHVGDGQVGNAPVTDEQPAGGPAANPTAANGAAPRWRAGRASGGPGA